MRYAVTGYDLQEMISFLLFTSDFLYVCNIWHYNQKNNNQNKAGVNVCVVNFKFQIEYVSLKANIIVKLTEEPNRK
jgi:hypothetical protein